MIIGTVVEGPSDRLVLQAVLDEICPGEHRYLKLQPLGNDSSSFGERGAGWKGVRRWCRQTWQERDSSLEKYLSGDTGQPLDLLVIQLDAEVAAEHDLQADNDIFIDNVNQPCPPVQPTVAKLQELVTRAWLKQETLPAQVIFAIPAQDTENWTFAALFPNDKLCAQDDYECIKKGKQWREHPGYCLTLKKYGKYLERKRRKDRNQGYKIKKPIRVYRKLAPEIADSWDTVRNICSQAEQFTRAVKLVLKDNQRAQRPERLKGD